MLSLEELINELHAHAEAGNITFMIWGHDDIISIIKDDHGFYEDFEEDNPFYDFDFSRQDEFCRKVLNILERDKQADRPTSYEDLESAMMDVRHDFLIKK